jgi:hypothetical protein
MLILNLKDHIRRGEAQPVTDWHTSAAQEPGFRFVEQIFVPSSDPQDDNLTYYGIDRGRDS